jgi:hypothetical protein
MLRLGLVGLRRPNEGIDKCMAAFTVNRIYHHESKTPHSCQAGRQMHLQSSLTPCALLDLRDIQGIVPTFSSSGDSCLLPPVRSLKRQRKCHTVSSVRSAGVEALRSPEQPSQEILDAWHAVNTVLFNLDSTSPSFQTSRLGG